MSRELSSGTTIDTLLGSTVIVGELVGGGRQGDVYRVRHNGVERALKWYRTSSFVDRAAFEANLRHNVMSGAPTDEFLWPLDITEPYRESFGYVMELCPSEYQEADEFFLRNVCFPSYRRATDACLSIANAFRILHNAGYCYQDVNGGNFFISPATGCVLIADNDNVAPDGVATGILGTPRYMAPEVVTGASMPNTLSDRYSMGTLIFMLLCAGHPLEGERSLVPVLDAEAQKRLYGTEALFVMDEDDRSNAPNRKIHRSMRIVWDCLPDHMKAIFLRAFSQDALRDGLRRPTEYAWMMELTRFRSEVVRCPCGNDVFVDGSSDENRCDACGALLEIPLWLEFDGHRVPAVQDARIYLCQTCVCDPAHALDAVAWVIPSRSDPTRLGIKNASKVPWGAITTKGAQRVVSPGEMVPLKEGIALVINDETVRITATYDEERANA